jgi:hypothetical protein
LALAVADPSSSHQATIFTFSAVKSFLIPLVITMHLVKNILHSKQGQKWRPSWLATVERLA